MVRKKPEPGEYYVEARTFGSGRMEYFVKQRGGYQTPVEMDRVTFGPTSLDTARARRDNENANRVIKTEIVE